MLYTGPNWDPRLPLPRNHSKAYPEGPLSDELFCVAWSGDGEKIASGSSRGVRLWTATHEQKPAYIDFDTGLISAVAMNPQGGTFAITVGNNAHLCDLKTGTTLRSFVSPAGAFNAVAFSRDGKQLATSSENQTCIWNISDGKVAAALHEPLGMVRALAYSPDGTLILSGSERGFSQVWEPETGSLVSSYSLYKEKDNNFRAPGRPPPNRDPPIRTVAWHPGGSVFCSGHSDGSIRVWQIGSSKIITAIIAHGKAVTFLAFSPDGSRFATSSEDSTVRIWNAQKYTLLLTLKKHSDPVTGLAFSPDGSRIVSVSTDGTTCIWDSRNPMKRSEALMIITSRR
jgi:WD40 repeat protein